jgi:FMN phosphatase YigB (HAD superfamily)
MVKSVLFDLDGTLLDCDTSIQQFITAQYDRLIAHLNHIPKTNYITRFISSSQEWNALADLLKPVKYLQIVMMLGRS